MRSSRCPAAVRAVVPVLAAAFALGAVACARHEAPAETPAATSGATVPAPAAAPVLMTIDDGREIVEAFRTGAPRELTGKRGADLSRAWIGWAAAHNADIRARLARGDEDSLVNFWMYGTSFTTRPRATSRDLAAIGGQDRALALLEGRLDDLVAALANPGANERLQFARQVLERRRIDVSTGAGQEQARAYLIDIRERALKESEHYRRTVASANLLKDPDARLDAFAAVYRERGLSSDTSINADFALDRAMAAAKTAGVLGRVRRVAIVGPGLDFTDKAEGYDFYRANIQLFAVADSLMRLGLRRPATRTPALRLSPRVNAPCHGAGLRSPRRVITVQPLLTTARTPVAAQLVGIGSSSVAPSASPSCRCRRRRRSSICAWRRARASGRVC